MTESLTYKAPVIDTGMLSSNYDDLIDTIEDSIINANLQVELPLTHTFTPGLYSREIFVPKGAVLTSKVHKESHQFLLLKGEMVIVSDTGAVLIKAPFHGTTMPGSTRIGIALQDSIWTTFHSCSLVEDKDYTKEELNSLVLKIENGLVEDRRPLNKIESCHSQQ